MVNKKQAICGWAGQITLPRPKAHAPNPAALPMVEAIKEIFKVFIPYPRLLDTTMAPISFHPNSAPTRPTCPGRTHLAALLKRESVTCRADANEPEPP